MRKWLLGTVTGTLAFTGIVGAAGAQDYQLDWYVHFGPAQLTLADEATIRLNGVGVPGASYASDPQTTSVMEIGRRWGRNWALSATVGLPPKADARGAGAVSGLGYLGSATYGPVAVTAHYHFNFFRQFEPYVGAGLSYLHVFDTTDGAISNLEIDNTFGPVLQAGANYFISDRWDLFFDVKKAWLATEARGTVSGAPVNADMVFDPLVINAGLAFRF